MVTSCRKNNSDSNLFHNNKGGTDLIEVLMIVAILALGLVGAIVVFGDSFNSKTSETSDRLMTSASNITPRFPGFWDSFVILMGSSAPGLQIDFYNRNF